MPRDHAPDIKTVTLRLFNIYDYASNLTIFLNDFRVQNIILLSWINVKWLEIFPCKPFIRP